MARFSMQEAWIESDRCYTRRVIYRVVPSSVSGAPVRVEDPLPRWPAGGAPRNRSRDAGDGSGQEVALPG